MSPRLVLPAESNPRLLVALYDRDGRTYLTINGQERDVTGVEQATVTLVWGAAGGCGALVSLERGGDVEVWPVERVEAIGAE